VFHNLIIRAILSIPNVERKLAIDQTIKLYFSGVREYSDKYINWNHCCAKERRSEEFAGFRRQSTLGDGIIAMASAQVVCKLQDKYPSSSLRGNAVGKAKSNDSMSKFVQSTELLSNVRGAKRGRISLKAGSALLQKLGAKNTP